MGFLDKIKDIWNIPEEDEYEEEFATEQPIEDTSSKKIIDAQASYKRESTPRARSKGAVAGSSQMQVVIFKPDHFEEAREIGDELNAKKTVILNLEATNREVSRRITDFLSGVAYANACDFKKVANNTFMIAPRSRVDVSGDLFSEGFDDSSFYY